MIQRLDKSVGGSDKPYTDSDATTSGLTTCQGYAIVVILSPLQCLSSTVVTESLCVDKSIS